MSEKLYRMSERLYTVKEVSRLLDLSESRIRSWYDRGELDAISEPGLEPGTEILIPSQSLSVCLWEYDPLTALKFDEMEGIESNAENQ